MPPAGSIIAPKVKSLSENSTLGRPSENPIAFAPHSQNSGDFKAKVESDDQILAAGQAKVDSDGRSEIVFGRSVGGGKRGQPGGSFSANFAPTKTAWLCGF